MPTIDKRIDAYIKDAQPFAQPILKKIRGIVHKACPNVEEKMKWSMPHFDYKGQMMCSMAAFKQHAVFGFWKASMLDDRKGILSDESAMGHLGRMTSVEDIPNEKALADLIKQAMKLNDEGVVAPRIKHAKEKKDTPMPPEFTRALKQNKDAKKQFDAFSPSHKREYIEWITEAKQEATRLKRLEQAIEWIAEGKSRNWKYMKK